MADVVVQASLRLDRFDDVVRTHLVKDVVEGCSVNCFKYHGRVVRVSGEHNCELVLNLNELVEDTDHNERIVHPPKSVLVTMEWHYLITRQLSADCTRVSLIWSNNGRLYLWTPTFRELFSIIRCSIHKRELVASIIRGQGGTGVGKSPFMQIQTCVAADIYDVLRGPGGIDIPFSAIYSLFEQILISEDLRYGEGHQLGRYYTLLALFDYVEGLCDSYDLLRFRYKLPS